MQLRLPTYNTQTRIWSNNATITPQINGKLVGVQQKLHLPQLLRHRTWIGRESCLIARRLAKYPRKSGCGQVTHHSPHPFGTIDEILIRNLV